MGEIVAAVGTCHTPYMFTRPPDENPQQLDQAGAAMQELGKVLDETKPDVILFFGADHVETFSVSCVPTFAIVAGSHAVARFAGREHDLPIHREMAEDILNKLVIEHNFDMAYSEDAELGHAFSIPFEYVIGQRNIPVIPFFTNVYVPPLPTPKRCEALGKALASIVKGRKERVAIIASGGMSHFPGTTKYLHPEFDFDRWLRLAVRGRQHQCAAQHDGHAARRSGQHRDAELGHHVRRDRGAEGRAHRLHPDVASRAVHDAIPAGADAEEPADGGRGAVRRLRVQGPGLPVLQASAGGSVRPEQAALRVASQRGAARAHHRRPRQRSPRSISCRASSASPPKRWSTSARAGSVSEHVGPLAEAGAHPLQALMALHVIFSTSHARGQQAMAGKH